ncbi:MAG: hypothetical protein H6727_05330 [Myxococcales bacterium]|nr:hypothetical protein [Myxococcales bacterium]
MLQKTARMSRWSLALAAMVLLSVFYVEPVFGQAMMTEREIKSLFSRARSKFKREDFEGASIDFYDIIENGTALPKYQRVARYYMSRALFRMKLGMVASETFNEVLNNTQKLDVADPKKRRPDGYFIGALDRMIETASTIGDETLILRRLGRIGLLRRIPPKIRALRIPKAGSKKIMIPAFADPIPYLFPIPPRMKRRPAMVTRWNKELAAFKDTLCYLMGRYYFLLGKGVTGQIYMPIVYLSQVSKQAPNNYFAKALYLMGTNNARIGLNEGALEYFQRVINIPLDKNPKGAKEKALLTELKEIKEYAQLGIARAYYALGVQNLDKPAGKEHLVSSLREYRKVPKNKGLTKAEVLFETAWVFYMLKYYHFSLGRLLGLQSAFYKISFFPELQILQSLIFFQNCKYEDTNQSIKRFEAFYNPLQKKMKALLARRTKDKWDTQYYDYFRQQQKLLKERKTTDLLPSLIAIVEQDKSLRNYQSLMDKTDAEIETIRSKGSAWKTSNLGRALLERALRTRSVLKKLAGISIYVALREIRKDVTKQVNQAQVIKLETLQKQKQELDRYAQGGGIEQDEYRYTLITEQSHIFWPYQGEYWLDEVAHYRQFIQGECKR